MNCEVHPAIIKVGIVTARDIGSNVINPFRYLHKIGIIHENDFRSFVIFDSPLYLAHRFQGRETFLILES